MVLPVKLVLLLNVRLVPKSLFEATEPVAASLRSTSKCCGPLVEGICDENVSYTLVSNVRYTYPFE